MQVNTMHVSVHALKYVIHHTAYLHLEYGKPSSALPNEAANSI